MKTASIVFALALLTSSAAAQTSVVGAGGVRQAGDAGNWWRDQQGGAFVDVTTNNGRFGVGSANSPYGTGSLEMSVTGLRDAHGRYPDWGFYYRFATGNSGFGRLDQLSSLSFDWFRSSIPGQNWQADPSMDRQGNLISPVIDWAYKTPVLRLLIQDDREVDGLPVVSELIWEGYYNQSQIGGRTVADRWNTTFDMHLGNFWFATPPRQPTDDLLVTDANCEANTFTFWEGEPESSGISQLTSEGGCLFGQNAKVIGIGVGVGSNWPLQWHGYVDNVRMGFGEAGATCTATGEECAVNANFDQVPATVPEPSTYALMAAGLLGIGAATRRRRRNDRLNV